jgi:hypothetical protein
MQVNDPPKVRLTIFQVQSQYGTQLLVRSQYGTQLLVRSQHELYELLISTIMKILKNPPQTV